MKHKPKLFIVTGISGSGKTTVARKLCERGEVAFDSKVTPGIYHFVDDEGRESAELQWNDPAWRRAYRWKLNRLMLDDLMRVNAEASRVFLCGRANIYQYMDLAEKVFLLTVTPETLIHRLNDEKRDNLFAKDSATQHKLVAELQEDQEKLIAKGAIAIDAEQPVGIVVNDILSASALID